MPKLQATVTACHGYLQFFLQHGYSRGTLKVKSEHLPLILSGAYVGGKVSEADIIVERFHSAANILCATPRVHRYALQTRALAGHANLHPQLLSPIAKLSSTKLSELVTAAKAVDSTETTEIAWMVNSQDHPLLQ